MARMYENPPAPPGEDYEEECEIEFYMPIDPRMSQFLIDENFVSMLHLLDETHLETPSVSEGEIEAGEEETHESKQSDIQHPNSLGLESTETVDSASLHAFIAKLKNEHNLPEKDDKNEKKARRSTSQSSSSSTEISLKQHKSTSLDKSSISHTRRSPSPKQSTSPFRRRLVEYPQSSSSTPSPVRPSRRKKPSAYKYSSKQRASPNRSSPTRQRYSRHTKSSIRSPSRSPTSTRSSSYYKSSRKTSSKQRSSHRRRSPPSKQYSSSSRSYTRSPPSPARSSSRCRYERSSKRTSPIRESPTPERSLTPLRFVSHSSRSSNRPKSPSVDKKSKQCSSRSNKSPVRQKNIPIKDEYTQLLVEEMKKRQIYDGSDLEDEPQVVEQNAATIEEKEIPKEKEPVILKKNDPKDLSEDEPNLVEKELEKAKEDALQAGPSSLQPKNVEKEIKSEFTDKKGCILNTFYCSSCQLSLNSEATWQSHISGKKHAKVLKLQTVHEVAKGSIAIPPNPDFEIEEIPRFANPASGMKLFPIHDVPRLQPVIDSCLSYPMLGLQSVREIRTEMEVHYYCELCDAPCSAHSIMPHLTGYKHQLNCLKKYYPVCYEKNKLLPKKHYERELSAILFEHERKFGRDQVKVFEERKDPHAMMTYRAYSQHGPSGINIRPIKKEKEIQGATAIPPNDVCLDTSKADFYCKLCDAHMNNLNMWEAHVRGKRHLTNAKKIPGENISKVRSVKAPAGVRCILEELIHETAADEIIVGLDFIKETQGPNGELYNCFLCGSCCTSFDIVNHLLLTKHRIRYLEKLAADGIENGITTISQMDMQEDYFRKHLIDDECRKMVEQFGSGKVEVYISK